MQNNLTVPVYIITGFLGCGKTRFVTEMLTDEGFSEGERTLLLCCEEGEDEYDPEALKEKMKALINEICWDEDRFIRGFAENGTVVGRKADPEANMWLNPQS